MCLQVESMFCASHETMEPVMHNSVPQERLAPAFNVASFWICSGKYIPLSGSKRVIDVEENYNVPENCAL